MKVNSNKAQSMQDVLTPGTVLLDKRYSKSYAFCNEKRDRLFGRSNGWQGSTAGSFKRYKRVSRKNVTNVTPNATPRERKGRWDPLRPGVDCDCCIIKMQKVADQKCR